MTIGKLLSLPLEERFYLLIKNRINNSYINEDGDLISVYSSFDVINKELINKGIDYRGKTIDDLILEIKRLSIQRSREDFENLNIEDWKKADGEVWESNRTDWEQLNVLKKCVLEMAFYAHDYHYNKMNLALKKEFKKICQFSGLLRKHKFDF
ncbi:hypothetical protein [Flavobacterium sp. CAN_S2]|uniref:hypothetical protein n=1 Tax=Flavobacterium sp. CAN_S2 TaxID=2787726 RepID=UPI0018C8EEBE